ncbi:hypothetical protein D3C72_1099360 [compost metagenome]
MRRASCDNQFIHPQSFRGGFTACFHRQNERFFVYLNLLKAGGQHLKAPILL